MPRTIPSLLDRLIDPVVGRSSKQRVISAAWTSTGVILAGLAIVGGLFPQYSWATTSTVSLPVTVQWQPAAPPPLPVTQPGTVQWQPAAPAPVPVTPPGTVQWQPIPGVPSPVTPPGTVSYFSPTPNPIPVTPGSSVLANSPSQSFLSNYGYPTLPASVLANSPSQSFLGNAGYPSIASTVHAQLNDPLASPSTRAFSNWKSIYLTPDDPQISGTLTNPADSDLYLLVAQGFDENVDPLLIQYRIEITNINLPAGAILRAVLFEDESFTTVAQTASAAGPGVGNIIIPWPVIQVRQAVLQLFYDIPVPDKGTPPITRPLDLSSPGPITYDIKVDYLRRGNNGIAAQTGNDRFSYFFSQELRATPNSAVRPRPALIGGPIGDGSGRGFDVLEAATWKRMAQYNEPVTTISQTNGNFVSPRPDCCCPNQPPFNGQGLCQDFEMLIQQKPPFYGSIPYPYVLQAWQMTPDGTAVQLSHDLIYVRFDSNFLTEIASNPALLLRFPTCGTCTTVHDWSLY